MKKVKVTGHKRRIGGKWKKVHEYRRKKRPKGKKRIVGKKAVRLYPVHDEYGRFQGWSRKQKVYK